MQNIVGYKGAIGGDAIAAGATANQVAGYDLSADHPVGVGYPGLSATIGTGGQISGEAWTPVVGYNNPTLPAFTQGGVDGIVAVKLVATGGANPLVGVGCGTCHDPHDFTQLFLRMNNSGSALCLKCHNK
jgi:predicted CXXCH cytochrome family protein